MPKEQNITNVTEAHISQWKKKYVNVYEIEAEGSVGYVKEPSREVMAYATSVAAKNPVKFNEIILDGIWLGGDETLKTEDSKFFGVSTVIVELIKISEGKIKKL